MSLSPAITDTGTALDPSALSKLQRSATANSPEAARAAAQQFEALFLGMVMKSMRDATPDEGLFSSEQSKMMTGMLDQQMAQALAARGIGLADVLVRQLSSQPASQSVSQPASQSAQLPAADSKAAPVSAPSSSRSSQFSNRLAPHAEAASALTGIPSRFLLAQAALESGWGKREIRNADGSSSHNIFGIKAGASWQGKTTEVMTTEYVNGVSQKKLQRFRAYDSYADAFSDYASTIAGSRRYAKVLAQAGDAQGFARGLQQAGYATDPRYADKLMNVIAKV